MTKRATRYFKEKKLHRQRHIENAMEDLLERYYENNLGERELDNYLDFWYDSPSVFNRSELVERINSYPLDSEFVGT